MFPRSQLRGVLLKWIQVNRIHSDMRSIASSFNRQRILVLLHFKGFCFYFNHTCFLIDEFWQKNAVAKWWRHVCETRAVSFSAGCYSSIVLLCLCLQSCLIDERMID
jgi:hypothetical protein